MNDVQRNTVAVRLTPIGRGAVAVVLVAGPAAVDAVERWFRAAAGRPFADFPPGRICYGRWGEPPGEDVVVVERPNPAGLIRPQVEVHCHGGRTAVEAVLAALVDAGCVEIGWQEWLAASEPDPIRAAALTTLADAPTERVARILLSQFHGALRSDIESSIQALDDGDMPMAARHLDGILQHGQLGRHLTRPWRVVLTGPTNVGKSSLINALVGFERAIVCELPGTTRDVVTTTTAIDGWPVQLADTAGLRATTDDLEGEGIRHARSMRAAADLVVLVTDARSPKSTDLAGEDVLSQLSPDNVLRVVNKIDLVAEGMSVMDDGAVGTSALTGQGIARLIDVLAQRLVPDPPAVGAAVPFTAHQIMTLELARNLVADSDAVTARGKLLSLLS